MAGTTTPGAEPLKRYLSPLEFSHLSGLSLATVHRYLKSGKIPRRQPGGHRSRILIPVDALETPSSPEPALAGAAAPATSAEPATAAEPSPSVLLPGPRPKWTRQAGPIPTKEH